MVEALLVYMVTILMLFLVLSLFSTLYEIWSIHIVANDTAVKAASCYVMPDADVTTGEIEEKDVTSVALYRYFLWRKPALEQSIQTKFSQFAKERLDGSGLIKTGSDPVIAVEFIHDGVSSNHVKVTIIKSFSMPFKPVLKSLGLKTEIEKTAVAYADCTDMIDYLNTVKYVEQMTSLKKLDSSFVDALNSLLGLITEVKDDIQNGI